MSRRSNVWLEISVSVGLKKKNTSEAGATILNSVGKRNVASG